MFAYHGRYLRIDVGTGQAESIPLDEGVLRSYLGGAGLGAWLLQAEGADRCDPLDAAAPLTFVFSPLVGSPLTTSAKFAVVSRSPLTDRINDSLASSAFAIAGKKTGYDAIVLVGRAERPTIVVVDDGRVTLQSAGDLWGRTCRDAETHLRAELGADYSTAVIGPAGETLVRYATISHDGRHAGRGGSGAVLGAKRVKALAVRGSQRVDWARPAELVAAAKGLSDKSFGPATAKYRELGTATNLLVFNRLGALPTRNFTAGSFPEAAAISPEQLSATRDKARKSCAACTIGCEHLYSLTPDKDDKTATGGNQVRLEYENLFALGPLCGIGDPQIVLRASQRCDELGLDTISAGGTIAFAMECAERGLLDAPDLRFGNGEALLKMLDDIASRQGLGDLLAEGSRRAAAAIGGDAPNFAPHVKGLEIPGYEPRALQTMALGFAVGTRGADHNRSGAYEVDFSVGTDRRDPGEAEVAGAIETEDRAAIIDSLILCKFLRGVFVDFWSEAADLLNLTTGWNVSAGELRSTARRIVAAKKTFNIACGWTPAEDTLPPRILSQPLPDDARTQLSPEKLQRMILSYNRLRGWSDDGYPQAVG